MEKIRPAQCGAALFGKETSQRGESCIVSPAVMAAMGSILTNKYAEGLPGCGGFLCRVFCAFFTNFCGRLCAEPNKTGANLRFVSIWTLARTRAFLVKCF
jgi:hypothetical protein